jgi:hypothetical protein
VAPVAFAPLLFRGFDLFLARGDKIPPDVARPAERRAAEKHEARALRSRRDADPVLGRNTIIRPDSKDWPATESDSRPKTIVTISPTIS